MQNSTPGNPQMNSVSDSSVGHQQTVKPARKPSQHQPPNQATMPPFTNQGMYCKSSDSHCNH